MPCSIMINVFVGILAVSTLSSKALFGHAELCGEYSNICELVTGCYCDSASDDDCVCNRDWWAYKPVGAHACPDKGCPLYLWMPGSMEANTHTHLDQFFMIEMLKRGFVAVNVGYDGTYSIDCEDNFFAQGLMGKAKAIFDGSDANSVVSQLCDGPNAIANCDRGIATHGWSQGAQIASLGGNFDKRVSATLLFGSGNSYSYLSHLSWKLSCLDNENLLLPKERRRSIVSSKDEIFGLTEAGVLEQQIETSGYDCGNNLHCFIKLPKGCEYGQDEQHCEATQRFYSASSCPACNSKSGKACPSNASLSVNECPISKVPDEYIGGDETIEDTGGYYLVSGEEFCAYPRKINHQMKNPIYDSDCKTESLRTPHGFFQYLHIESDFMNPSIAWGLPQNFDWLALTATKTAHAIEHLPSLTESTMSPLDFFSNKTSEIDDELV